MALRAVVRRINPTATSAILIHVLFSPSLLKKFPMASMPLSALEWRTAYLISVAGFGFC
jgi:hypothetical protein